MVWILHKENRVSSKYAKLTFMNLCVVLWPLWHLLYCPTRQIPDIWYFGQAEANVKMFCICKYYPSCSTATHNFIPFSPTWWKEELILHIWCPNCYGIRFWHLKDRKTLMLMLEHHTSPHQWQMYSSIIIQRNCSYLCFKGTSSKAFIDFSPPPTPAPTQPPAVIVAAVAIVVTAVCAAAAPFAVAVSFRSQLAPACILHVWSISKPAVNLQIIIKYKQAGHKCKIISSPGWGHFYSHCEAGKGIDKA